MDVCDALLCLTNLYLGGGWCRERVRQVFVCESQYLRGGDSCRKVLAPGLQI